MAWNLLLVLSQMSSSLCEESLVRVLSSSPSQMPFHKSLKIRLMSNIIGPFYVVLFASQHSSHYGDEGIVMNSICQYQ